MTYDATVIQRPTHPSPQTVLIRNSAADHVLGTADGEFLSLIVSNDEATAHTVTLADDSGTLVVLTFLQGTSNPIPLNIPGVGSLKVTASSTHLDVIVSWRPSTS